MTLRELYLGYTDISRLREMLPMMNDLHEANKAFLSLATLLHARSIVFYVLKVCCFLP